MNEKVFFIGIELNSISSKEKFENFLASMGNDKYIKISESVYAVKRPYSFTAESIRMQIMGLFADNCQVFIMKSSIEAAWNVSSDVDIWLKNNI